ncbi:MAG: caspase family protein [Anaerolineae bacterium]
MASPRIRALLVGINRYDNPLGQAPALAGCVNDVESMAALLQARFGAAEGDVMLLRDGEATLAAVTTAFEQHLIAAAEDWARDGKPEPEPAWLFYFSGHGSQAPDRSGEEPDGWDETLVFSDSRSTRARDLRDFELGAWIAGLSAISQNVTIVLDCCHSGSGTRAITDGTARSRRAAPDSREFDVPRPARVHKPGARGLSGVGDGGGAGHVLIAGCMDGQESFELESSEGGPRTVHGALSYYLQRALAQMPPGAGQTYEELLGPVASQVNARYQKQTPQLEGDRRRLVFGTGEPAVDSWLRVVKRDGVDFVVDGGLIYGLRPGTVLAAYPPGTRERTAGLQPTARLVVSSAEPMRSVCRLQDGSAADGLPPQTVLAIERLQLDEERSRVGLDGMVPARREAVRQALEGPEARGLLRVVPDGEQADFRVSEAAGTWQLRDGAGAAVVEPIQSADTALLRDRLCHLARYLFCQLLRNDAADSRLSGKVRLDVLIVSCDQNGYANVDQAGAPETSPARQEGGETWLKAGDRIAFQITNRSSQPVFCAILELGDEWDITPVTAKFFAGANERFGPGSHTIWRRTGSGKPIRIVLPAGRSEFRSTFKLIASTQELGDLADLQLASLGAPPSVTRGAAVAAAGVTAMALPGMGRRGMTDDDDASPETATSTADWTTFELKAVGQAGDSAISQASPDGRIDLSDGRLVLQAPAGLNLSARLLTQRAVSRGVDSRDPADPTKTISALRPPPVLQGGDGLPLQPFRLGAARSLDGAPEAIELRFADPLHAALVTAADPLHLTLSEAQRGNGDLLVVADNGELWVPLVLMPAGTSSVKIDALPTPTSDLAVEPGVPARRSLGRAIRLYLYSAAGIPLPELGLHRARWVPEGQDAGALSPGARSVKMQGGTVIYERAARGDLRPKQRVGLLVHGFSSDTEWMVTSVEGTLAGVVQPYDVWLCFDYETLKTGIDANGAALAKALGDLGLGAQDDIYVDAFGHSMGTQVLRSMIQNHGGHAFIDRAFLAGPPNAGTPLATLKRPAVWLMTLGLNHLTGGVATMVAGLALRYLSSNLEGMDSLKPTDALYKGLNQPSDHDSVPYHVFIGDNSDQPLTARSAWERLARQMGEQADAVTDLFFGGQSDLVIPIDSALALDSFYPPELRSAQQLPCDHFNYFVHPKAREAIQDAARGGPVPVAAPSRPASSRAWVQRGREAPNDTHDV